jgi:amino acid transporter
MKFNFPRTLWISGLLVLLAAFAYAGVSGAGVPYQDPTPEMRAREISQNRTIDTLAIIGGILLVVGLIWSALLRLFTKNRPLNQLLRATGQEKTSGGGELGGER